MAETSRSMPRWHSWLHAVPGAVIPIPIAGLFGPPHLLDAHRASFVFCHHPGCAATPHQLDHQGLTVELVRHTVAPMSSKPLAQTPPLATSSAPPTEATPTETRVDVLIVTAVKDEYEEALKVDDGALDNWEKKPGPIGLEVAFRTYDTKSGGRMRIALTRALDMRGVATAAVSAPLIAAYQPRCLAMCGVCAGRRGETNLGDVIVGDPLYTYDAGAIQASYDGGKRQEHFRDEPNPYRLAATWKQRAESFSLLPERPWLAERPQSLQDQAVWLLARLQSGDATPWNHPDRKVRCPRWPKVIERLRKKEFITNEGLELTEQGRKYIADFLLLNPDGLPPPPDFQVRVGPIATGMNVIRDDEIFERLAENQRKVLALEMEAQAIGAIAHVSGIPWMIVMKGVMDHADLDKEDGFKSFAARASAECLIAFLKENLPDAPQEPTGRLLLPPASEKGVVPLVRAWETWAQATKPPLPPSLLLAGRKDSQEQLLAWHQKQPSVLALQTDTLGEAIAFLYAALGPLSETERSAILSRTYVVEEIDAWHRWVMSRQPLLLIPTFSDRAAVAAGVTHGHHILLPIGLSEPVAGPTLKLLRIGRAEAGRALMDAGVAANQADELAKVARSGLGALRRKLAIHPAALLPAWATSQFARVLLPAILAGSWQDRRQDDQEIIEQLASRPYAEVRESLIYWASQPDPPVRLVAGTTWTVVSAEEAWSLVMPCLTATELSRFEAAFLRVLGELDPALDLPPEQRWMAAMHQKVRRYSPDLRRGMTESLAIIATQHESATGQPISGTEWADRIAGQLFRQCTSWQMWASVCDQLPLLAEAAPEPFLAVVDRDLSTADPLLAKLFDDKVDPLIYHSPHTGLLWALETLAWSPRYLSEAAVALARLDQLDPGGRTANRPRRSLLEIFLLRHPSTMASLDRRLQVLNTIQRREPEAGWRLLLQLLPGQQIMADSTRRPYRRDWAGDSEKEVTYAEIYRGASNIVQSLLDSAGSDGSHWSALINALEVLLPDDRRKIFDALRKLDLKHLSDKDHQQIWAAIRHQLSHHLQFAETEWALPPEAREDLQALYRHFEPEGYLKKSGWLFSSRPELPIAEKLGWEEREEAIAKTRREVTKTIFETHGIDGIRAMASEVEQPGALGFSFGSSAVVNASETEFLNSVLGSSTPALRDMGLNFLIGRASLSDGQEWFQGRRTAPEWLAWSARQKADYYLCCPFVKETWDVLDGEEPEVQKLYWSEVSILGRGQVPVSDCERAIKELSKFGRLVSAVELVYMYGRRGDIKVKTDLIVSTLEAITRAESIESITQQNFWYTVADLIHKLGKDENADKTRVARLEWLFLPWLRDHRQPLILNEMLRENPDLFVETLSLIYRAEGEPPAEVSAENRTRAEQGYQLLDNWNRPPGLSEDGQLDGKKLRSWVNRVRELASASGRGKVADYRIGEILARLPKGTDDVWPIEGVRDLLEDKDIGSSEPIQKGLVSGVRNGRGMTRRAIGEGGQQERSLAELYYQYAEQLTDRWPRTARLLRIVASSYESDARFEDIRAELDELRWG